MLNIETAHTSGFFIIPAVRAARYFQTQCFISVWLTSWFANRVNRLHGRGGSAIPPKLQSGLLATLERRLSSHGIADKFFLLDHLLC